MQWPSIPRETLDEIFFYLHNPEILSPLHPSCSSPMSAEVARVRRSICDCALVCKEWLPVARHHLLRVQFLQGEVKILQDGHEISTLITILHSPLCTFDRSFVKALRVVAPYNLPRHFRSKSAKPLNSGSFFTALSTTHGASFDSLDTLIFETVCPNPGNGIDDGDDEHEWEDVEDDDWDDDDDDDAYEEDNDRDANGSEDTTHSQPIILEPSSTSLLSQIKHLNIQGLRFGTPFAYIAHTILLCISLEKLTLQGGLLMASVADEKYLGLRPPGTLRKLDLDSGIKEMAEWLLSCKPQHTQISHVKKRRFNWPAVFDSDTVRYLFEGIGPHLEELELEMGTTVLRMDHHKREPFVVEGDHVIPFLKNSSLKRLGITIPLDMAFGLLPYLFAHGSFAPALETLEIIVYDIIKEHILVVEKLVELDGYLHSRPFFRQLTFTSSGGEIDEDDWKILEAGVRKSLPQCEMDGKLSTLYRNTGMIEISGSRVGKPTRMMLGSPDNPQEVFVRPIIVSTPSNWLLGRAWAL